MGEQNSENKILRELEARYDDLVKSVNYSKLVGSGYVERCKFDFNTLINLITGYIYTGLESAEPSVRQSLNGALDTTRVLVTRATEMTDYFSLVFGSYESQKTPFSLSVIIRQVNQELDEDISVKDIEFSYEIDHDIPTYIEQDHIAIKKAVVKLVQNAIENTQNGSVKIKCEKMSETKDDIVIQVSVIDTGKGINERKIATLLADRHIGIATGQTELSGYGLLIAKDFLKRVGATIKGKNNNNDIGSTFSFVFTAEKVGEESFSESEIDEDQQAKVLEGVSVLLTDDSIIMQQIVKQMLTLEGANVTSVLNGQEAFEKFKENEFDIVLMDVEMPVLNGYEAAALISEYKEENGIKSPVIGMTAHTEQEEYDKCYESGMSYILNKPFKQENLLDAIFKMLYNKDYVPASEGEKQQEEQNKQKSIYNFETIKGIDYKEGLQRLSGNEKLYFELLQNFRDGYGNCTETITELLKEGNDNQVKNLLHLIKGISGNLSFNEVYDYSNRLREAVDQDNIVDISNYLKLLDEAISEFKKSFQEAELAILYHSAEVDDMDTLMVKNRLDELLTYLSGDVDLGNAMDACDDLNDYMSATGHKKEFARIRNALNSFDIDLAISLLKPFKEDFQ